MYTRSRKTTSVKRHGLSRPAYITDPYRGLSSHQAGSTPHRLTRNDVDFRISDDPVFFHVQNTRNVCPTTHPDQNWNNARSNYKTNIEHRKLEQTRHWAQRRVSSTKKKRLQPSSHTNEYNTKSARGQISCVILYRYDVSSEFKQSGPHVFWLSLDPDADPDGRCMASGTLQAHTGTGFCGFIYYPIQIVASGIGDRDFASLRGVRKHAGYVPYPVHRGPAA